MLAKTVSSRDAATEPAGMHSRRVLAGMSISRIKLSHWVGRHIELYMAPPNSTTTKSFGLTPRSPEHRRWS